MELLKRWFQPLPTEPDVVVEGLRRACAFTACYWANILRQATIAEEVQLITQTVGVELAILDSDLIETFQATLKARIIQEVSQIEYDPADPDCSCRSFERWVGCWEYSPSTYLGEIAKVLGISALYFRPKTGWYVNPGKVIDRCGKEFRV